MSNYYTYLISSLPGLYFEAKAPFSFQGFLELCSPLISESDLNILKQTSITTSYSYNGTQPTLKKWSAYETALRNELVKTRAARKHIDPSVYLRGDSYADPSITHIALSAHRSPSILEGEKILDLQRWHVLDGFSMGHYFDIDFLITYALKLLILERWENMRALDKDRALEDLLKK